MRRLVASIAALIPVMALGVVPSDGGPVTAITPVDINVSSGDQYDPHVNGDLAAYTSSNTIRYYNFGTGNDLGVPTAADTADQLSDVSNGRIVFSRVDFNTGDIAINVFDTMTSVTTPIGAVPGTLRASGAIGSDTVAFIDATVAPSELWASDIGGTPVKITTDARIDQRPQVAPLGDLIVYESCQTVGSNCDVRQAAWNGSSWVVTALTNNSEPESNPDSDGLFVVYDATRSGERDIYWQHAGGDAEQNLTLSGEQRNPSVSGGVIAFESVEVGDTAADLYVYQIATNRLYRVTSTPDNETLNDVYVLNDGRVRMVWASGAVGSRNVHGATFELSGGGSGGGGGSCEPEEVSFAASVNYHKHSWDDGAADVADLSFSIPASIPTTEGNAANGTLFLKFWNDGGEVVRCLYKGDGKTGDGRTDSRFVFHHCTDDSVTAGSTVTADHVRVRVQNADENLAKTSVGVTIGTTCPPGSATVQLGNDAPTTVGCSSSGGTFTFVALALALLAWIAPRRAAVQVRSRRPTR